MVVPRSSLHVFAFLSFYWEPPVRACIEGEGFTVLLVVVYTSSSSVHHALFMRPLGSRGCNRLRPFGYRLWEIRLGSRHLVHWTEWSSVFEVGSWYNTKVLVWTTPWCSIIGPSPCLFRFFSIVHAVSVYLPRGATQPDILQIHTKCVTILASVDSLKNASYLLPNVFATRSYQRSATTMFPSATVQPTGPQIFQQSCSHLKTLGPSRGT